MLASIRNPVSRLVATVSTRVAAVRSYSAAKVESDAEFENRWINYFSKPTLDGWELRKGLNDLQGVDQFPEPKIVASALEACRRINEHSVAVRYLEALKWKAGPDAKVIYPWLIQELRPTLDKLKISTPEELGLDKPEFGLKNVFEMHGPKDY